MIKKGLFWRPVAVRGSRSALKPLLLEKLKPFAVKNKTVGKE